MRKSIVAALSVVAGGIIGAVGAGKTLSEKGNKYAELSKKHLALFLLMNQWVKVKQEGKNLAEYFENKGYKNIAVYGMSYAGETLVNELKDTDIKVIYGIDKNTDLIHTDINIVSIDDDLKKVDAIVVTAITFFEQIKKELSEKTDCPVVSLEDILYLL